MPDDELADLARHWRSEALRGSRDARGTAHLYEVELRRRGRNNINEVTRVVLDMRPLSAREKARPWWCLW
jgi:hypothetical protein